jgi:hypothetical protein
MMKRVRCDPTARPVRSTAAGSRVLSLEVDALPALATHYETVPECATHPSSRIERAGLPDSFSLSDFSSFAIDDGIVESCNGAPPPQDAGSPHKCVIRRA